MLLLYASMLELNVFIKNKPGELEYATFYEDMLERIHAADRSDRYPAGALQSRSEAGVV